MVWQNVLKEATLSNIATPEEKPIPPVQSETVSVTNPTVVAEETRSNPPQEARSNPSQATEVGIKNTTTYSHDVNSTESPSEECQFL